jgi:penicillin-binding protein 1B
VDLHLQRIAQQALQEGLDDVDRRLARDGRAAQAALIAIEPASGDILALVGGRSYSRSQFNRATRARRQPGSVFKPFVYLAGFERALATGRRDLTPATLVSDSPTTFMFGRRRWNPANYGGEYGGAMTLRRALALSRNVPAVKVASGAGYDQVAALWKRVGAGTLPQAYPSIALGVFEATPLEIAGAYTVFPNGGERRALRAIRRISSAGRDLTRPVAKPLRVARRDTTFLVTNMMRSVLTEGTGVAARSAGFTLDAAAKSGTTNDLRDAWFVGFTPELLTVVWVGLDDNLPLGLTGTQAALPIWTTFMKRALAGREDRPFPAPAGLRFVDVDSRTGGRATPSCPSVIREAFLSGTEPSGVCPLHGG